MVKEKLLKEFGTDIFLTEDELFYINNFEAQEDRPILILDFGSQLTALISLAIQ